MTEHKKIEWFGLPEAFRHESDERHSITKDRICQFGIAPLDHALGGLLPSDLCVIGADSGAGKSELALHMAQHNAARGKRVILYFLEGGHLEAVARMKWRDMVREYFASCKGMNVELDYRKWRLNMLNEAESKVLLDVEAAVYRQYKEKYGDRLQMFDVKKDFSMETLLGSLTDWADLQRVIERKPYLDVDMIIVDHLQYFSLPEGEKEIESITNIMREVKEVTQFAKVPVVMVSHLRKKYRDRGLPDQEDFYGSSNIPKIASMAITIAPDRGSIDYALGQYPTFIRICKCRTGISSSLAIRCNFDLDRREYDEIYTLHRIDAMGAVQTEQIPQHQLPRWAS